MQMLQGAIAVNSWQKAWKQTPASVTVYSKQIIRACSALAVRQLQNLLISDFSVKVCASLNKLLREYPGKMGRNWVVLRYFYPSDWAIIMCIKSAGKDFKLTFNKLQYKTEPWIFTGLFKLKTQFSSLKKWMMVWLCVRIQKSGVRIQETASQNISRFDSLARWYFRINASTWEVSRLC